jgi:hypothetical protein
MTHPTDLSNYCDDLTKEIVGIIVKRLREDGFTENEDSVPIVTMLGIQIMLTMSKTQSPNVQRVIKNKAIRLLNVNLPD